MNYVSELKAILQEIFHWNKARLECFVRMLLALFAVRTVNLSEIAIGFASSAKVTSRYKRLHRFFKQFKIDYDLIAIFIFKLFFSDKKVYLTIDRTNWFLGKSKINIFMLGIAYEGVSIPLFWKLLPKAGSSNFKEQRALIHRFIRLFGTTCMVGLLADREFANGQLFNWLNKKKIPFYIRIKEGMLTRIGKKKFFTAKKLFNDLNPKTHKIFGMNVRLLGQTVYLAGSRSEKGELMIVATNQSPKNAIATYLRRWEIETLFSCLKTRGFKLEETHITKLERLEKLIALLSVGFCWAHKTGEYLATQKPIVLKKHRESFRPQNSFFRHGFDYIRELLLSPFKKITEFKTSLQLLSLKTLIAEGGL